MIDGCLNYQDAYPLAMLYYGFKGEEYKEIRNLKVAHINRIASTIYIESTGKTEI